MSKKLLVVLLLVLTSVAVVGCDVGACARFKKGSIIL